MKKINLLVDMADGQFGEALGAYITCNARNFSVQIGRMSDDAASFGFKPDVVLTDRMPGYCGYQGARHIFLDERPNLEGVDTATESILFKYRPASVLLTELQYLCSPIDRMSIGRAGEGRLDLVGFYGAQCAGRTAVSVSVAREIARRLKKRVLYLDYGFYPSLKAYFKESHAGRRGLSEYLYYSFKEDDTAAPFDPKPYMFTDPFGVSAFYPDPGPGELTLLEPAEMERFIRRMQALTCFDQVVIDFEERIDPSAAALMAQCRVLCNVTAADAVSTVKNDLLKRHLFHLGGEKMIEKTVCVQNRAHDDIDASPEVFMIPEDRESFGEVDGIVEIAAGGKFGIGISTLADGLVSGFGR